MSPLKNLFFFLELKLCLNESETDLNRSVVELEVLGRRLSKVEGSKFPCFTCFGGSEFYNY